MSLDYLLTWMLVLLRTLGVILQLPVVAGRPLPVAVRVGLCVCIATLIAGIVPAATLPAGLWDLLLVVGGEVALGLALGFVGRMAFAAVEMAGRIMSTEIGLSANPGLGVPEPANEPLAALVSTFAIVLFFLFGGHLMMLSALTRSQVVAGMLTLVAGITLLMLNWLAQNVSPSGKWQAQVLSFFNLSQQMVDFTRGVLDTRIIVYYVCVTFFFLFLTLRVIESRRWK